ncbi:hypothetical protein [Halomonas nitroreducens]|uniref:Uncharacterized protein n=1 Tax=Halomonas nitroreducens TaxID=447425 RepID=A0A3S0HU73_9GAMM|nr:hypothetical protein [Halomonas nitroreducens]RTR05652.1 hypothetical protein EKG36_06055 [Halomonas nitroreducens]
MKMSRWLRVKGRVALLGSATILAMTWAGASLAEELQQSGFDTLQRMAPGEMAQARGRDGVNVQLDQVNVQSVQDMEAVAAGSSFTVVNGDMMTGPITFEQDSMGHYSGTGIFNNVTGNANAINNAIGISVYVSSP